MNREFLKEAIADAKAVKESAIANAKAALEESFTPHLKSMLAAKINEMEEEDELKEYAEEQPSRDMDGDGDVDAEDVRMMKEIEEEMDLDEILAELEEMDEEQLNEVEEEELEDSDADGIPDEKDKAPKGEAEEEEEINLEDMSEEDLKSFIESVIADMVKAGELEAGHESEEEEEEELKMTMEAEEEIDIDEAKDAKYKAMEAKMKKMEEELNETRKALKTVKFDLNEVNLLNAKLLYTNKIFRNKNLTESQKVKVLGAFDKAANVKEVKLVFETISESLNTPKKSISESVIGRASKPAGISTTTKQPIVESNEMITRFQKLAGII